MSPETITPLVPHVDVLMCTRGALRTCIDPLVQKPVVLRSSTGATLLKDLSNEVIGVTLKLQECEQARGSRSCCGVDGLVRARAVAGQLGIRHYVLDCVTEFEQSVLHPAWEEYARGRTPSPCLLCNERIKFGLLLSWSRAIGASHVATGHYARIERDADGSPALLRGLDRAKDQSYFLAGLGAEQLRSVLFPLGSLTKQKVRSLAASLKLPCATTRDSQGACLVREGQTFAEMLRLRFGASARHAGIRSSSCSARWRSSRSPRATSAPAS